MSENSGCGELERRLRIRGQNKLGDELTAIYRGMKPEWKSYSYVADAWRNFEAAIKKSFSSKYEEAAITEFMSRLDSLGEEVERLRGTNFADLLEKVTEYVETIASLCDAERSCVCESCRGTGVVVKAVTQ